ncbi:MAG: metalloregulator ArsR/SmtB family transcription factor [Gammaproteobacteria bacterium]|jgi:DNA-binding transcriptional ArsR family regulator
MSAFAVLAEPNRRRLLDVLLGGPQPVSVLVEAIGMSQPVVSKHLRVLRDAGLVSVEPDGQRRLYSIRPQPLAEVDEWLEPYRRFWSDKLEALARHLDTTKDEEGG